MENIIHNSLVVEQIFSRCIGIIDMDCYFVQVEQVREKETKGLPAVVGGKLGGFGGGGIVATNYEARRAGIPKYGFTIDKAKRACPSLIVFDINDHGGFDKYKKTCKAFNETIEIYLKEEEENNKLKLEEKFKENETILMDLKKSIYWKNSLAVCQEASVDETFMDLTNLSILRLVNLILSNSEEEIERLKVIRECKKNRKKCIEETFYYFITETEHEYLVSLIYKEIHLTLTSLEYFAVDSHIEGNEDNFVTSFENSMDYSLRLCPVGELHLFFGNDYLKKIRNLILEKNELECSGGLSDNKMLAKLACGMKKPNQQVMIPKYLKEKLFRSIPVRKIPFLGGKNGKYLEENLNIRNLQDLAHSNLDELNNHFSINQVNWLKLVAKGICVDEVKVREAAKSVGISRNFPVRDIIDSIEKLQYNVEILTCDLIRRLKRNEQETNRRASSLTVAIAIVTDENEYGARFDRNMMAHMLRTSKCGQIDSKSRWPNMHEFLVKIWGLIVECMKVFENRNVTTTTGQYSIVYLGLSVSKFFSLTHVHNQLSIQIIK
ncbi:hypothetical protein SNEBB_001679 [Seison nebaliae]|nr:hypothetical protein SNEBB_001679 [Seison nebaliae]